MCNTFKEKGDIFDDVFANQGLQNHFDKDAVQKEIDLQVAVTKTFSSVAPNVVATYAQSQTKAYTDAQVKQSALKGILENTTDPEKRAELTAQLNQVQATLNAEQATYDQWKEGGSARVILHTAIGGLLTGDVSGALGAGSTAALAPQINEVKNSLPDELKGAFNLVAGAAIGAVTGGEAGAFTGSAIDWNNRQLHDTEIERIKKIADEFAKENNLKPEEAERRLLAQAMKNIDKEYYEKHAIYDEKADKYLNKKATFFTTAEGEKLLTFAPMSYYEDSSKFAEQQGFANARNSLKTQAVFTWDEKQSVANAKTWDTLKDGTIKGAINAPIELYNIPASWISEDFTIPPIPYDNEMEEKVATDIQAVWANYTSVVGAGLNRAKQVGIGLNQGIKGKNITDAEQATMTLYRKMSDAEAKATLNSGNLQAPIKGTNSSKYLSESLNKVSEFNNKAVEKNTTEVIVKFTVDKSSYHSRPRSTNNQLFLLT